MILAPIIALDVGSACAAGLVAGTFDCPVLLEAKRWSRFDAEKVVAQLKRWRRGRGRGAAIWCEGTFSERRTKKRFLGDVGRKQEAQIGILQALMGEVFERVPPVNGTEAMVAWQAFGRPAIGEGDAGEHGRDMLGVALKALNRRNETAEQWMERVALNREFRPSGR